MYSCNSLISWLEVYQKILLGYFQHLSHHEHKLASEPKTSSQTLKILAFGQKFETTTTVLKKILFVS